MVVSVMSQHLTWWLVFERQEVEVTGPVKGYKKWNSIISTVFFSKEVIVLDQSQEGRD